MVGKRVRAIIIIIIMVMMSNDGNIYIYWVSRIMMMMVVMRIYNDDGTVHNVRNYVPSQGGGGVSTTGTAERLTSLGIMGNGESDPGPP